ncbi:hypothetical protein KP509_07G042600 [Ceratopteris richardii]|uniref:Cucumopine synthase C-terminal helical bundle domain-containing protein n=1 Tax=Ceratopteris richardii TaxID=49495 RepID=A0A8T2UG60_CERRI|nr:hypothetical protein KP509_07G042600 [Ceratopteris richardii]
MSGTHFSSLSEVSALIAAARNRLLSSRRPKCLSDIYSGQLQNQAGTNGQFFSTFDFANGLIRDASMCTWYSIVKLAEDSRFSIDHIITIIDTFDAPFSNYLRYSGFPELAQLVTALQRHLPLAKDRKELITAVREFCGYYNLLAAWSFHLYPWSLSNQFRYKERMIKASPTIADLCRRVRIQHGQKVKLSWMVMNEDDPSQFLGEVSAVLAVKENPELCDDFIAALEPKGFRALQVHAVVSGESMYAWVPLVSTARVRVKERQCDAPIGRIRYSQNTGNKMIIQYGPVTEDIETPVLGEVDATDLETLREVGQKVLQNTFAAAEAKKEIWTSVRLA